MYRYIFMIFIACLTGLVTGQARYAMGDDNMEKRGAILPWTTIYAETMDTNGRILGPAYGSFSVEIESSNQRCIKLTAGDGYASFHAPVSANAMVIRYSLPDAAEGGGLNAALLISINKEEPRRVDITSRYSWLYGHYPFNNKPQSKAPRNFYDEVRVPELDIARNDIVTVQLERGGAANHFILDLVDLEMADAPRNKPDQALSITDARFKQQLKDDDYTDVLRACIAEAAVKKQIVWIPAGIYRVTGTISLPAGVRVQGAGMWHSNLVGDDALYDDPQRRVRFQGTGEDIHLSDFAIIGKLTYRNDREPNDGIVGSFVNSTISRIWLEHVKVGMWVTNSSNLTVEGCRFRNTIADGLNFSVGCSRCVVRNTSARGTGDDCFAMWPATYRKQKFDPGFNTVEHCTAELPFLAQGISIYGGTGNRVVDCLVRDIGSGAGIFVASRFPVSNRNVDNGFKGTTVIERCILMRCGGNDQGHWREAIQVYLHLGDIPALRLDRVQIVDSLSGAIGFVSVGKQPHRTSTEFSDVEVKKYGLAYRNSCGLKVSGSLDGTLLHRNTNLGKIVNGAESFRIDEDR